LTLTAAIYNADHQNHIDNGVPLQLDDYSSSVVQMQTTTNPGEVGTESQATSLAGEIERIRFIIKEITGEAQWYASPTPSAWQLIAEKTPTAASTINFATGIDTTYDHYMFAFKAIRPNTANAALRVRVSVNAGTTYSTTSNYIDHSIIRKTGLVAVSGITSTGRSFFGWMANNLHNTVGAGTHGQLFFRSPSATTGYKHVDGSFSHFGSTSRILRGTTFTGSFLGTSAAGTAKKAINAVRFFLNSGVFVATGRIALYGLRRSI
jgi:hypothetical protein